MHHYFGVNVLKVNKKILRIQSLMKIGVLKNKAFWIVSMGLWEVTYGKAKKFSKINGFKQKEYQAIPKFI